MKMKDVDQTHPNTNDTFGMAVYGPAPVADGGYERSTDEQTMEDVEHESPAKGAVRSFERGPNEDDSTKSVSDE